MNLLLDTHVLLWWLGDDPLLRPEARTAINHQANEVWVSAVTAWEMSIKTAARKLESPDNLSDTLRERGIKALAISLDHGVAAGKLPRHHGDPFDRMLIAQALSEGLTIVTRDRHFAAYGVSVLGA